MRRILLYLSELRAPFFSASIIPVLLGAAVAYNETAALNLRFFLLTLLGILLLHAGTNVANDYFDHRSGCDPANIQFVRPFTGGSRLIQKGLLSPKAVLTESIFLFAFGSLIGLYLAFQVGYPVLILGAIGVFCGYFYSAPPLKLADRGVGELLIALNFGTLVTLGSNYVQTQKFALSAALASIPIAVLIGAVIYINEFPDAAADASCGKRTLVVRLGKEKASRVFTYVLLSPYIFIACAVAFRFMPVWSLLALLPFPLSAKAMIVCRGNYACSERLTPANASTILVHILVGLLLITGYMIDTL
jgi:1,4-dihydroxy-2-naphthoate octaprenyltransferase